MMMKVNKWTLGLAAVGLVTLPAFVQAEEAPLSALQTLGSSTVISGYVDTSAQWQIGEGSRPPSYAFNYPSKQDGFNLNAVNVTIKKDLDQKEQWAAGYTVEMIYGPNAAFYNTSANAFSGSDFAIKQAYVAMRAPVGNGLDVRMGVFDSILGYEVFNAGNNPNYTRSWGYTAEPTQMTGLLLSYQFTKEIGVSGGIANTANAGINNRSFLGSAKSETDKTYMAALTLTAPESMGFLAGSTLYGAVVNGFNTTAFDSASGTVPGDSQTYFYGGMTVNTPLKGLQVGLCYDYVGNHGSLNGSTKSGQTSWFDAASLYLSYKATPKLSFHARAEYVWMKDGTAASMMTVAPATALADKMVSLTGTVQYDIFANVISRLELRYDHAADGSKPFNIEDRNAWMVAANFIYKF